MKRTLQVLTIVAAGSLAAGWLPAVRADAPPQAARAPQADTGLLERADKRFAASDVREVPSFQRHVLPVMGRLGCNGRACHGSFQGQGGFRLSLFGYDFKADHEALLAGDDPRVDLKNPRASLMLVKPTATDKDEHGGGHRLDVDSWSYRLLLRWIEAGAPAANPETDPHFVRLEVSPQELVFKKPGQMGQLRVLSHWSDGSVEDVTPLCRFQTNDDAVAKVDEAGRVKILGKGDTHVVVFYDNGVVPIPVLLPVSDAVGKAYPQVPAPTKIDQLVIEKLRKLGIVPSGLCTDAEFLRRASLDIVGALPSPEEIQAFVADKAKDKRQRKIDELLERPAHAVWWATKLCDVTGNNERSMPEQSFRAEYFEQWYHWVHKRVSENVPYDKIVEGMVMATSKLPGQNYADYTADMTSYIRKDHPRDFADRPNMPHYWSRRTARTANEKALSFSYAFLGVRLQCAECHKHPFDQWSQEDFKHFTAFFNRITFGTAQEDRATYLKMSEQLGLKNLKGNEQRQLMAKLATAGKPVPVNELYISKQGSSGGRKKEAKKLDGGSRVITPKVLGGEEVIASSYDDPRQPLMDWLRQGDNPYFARAFVNRVWSAYFNVGIVEPPDDMNLANAPSNAELLDYLSREFVKHGYDMKWLHREIANSRTYQLSWLPNETNQHDLRNFSHAVPRRLPAEVAYDAVVKATAGARQLELRDADPVGLCAIGVAKGYTIGIGRNRTGYALAVFGKPMRETTCDCERSSEPTLLQTIFLRNDDEVLNFIDRPEGWVSEVAQAQKAHEVMSAATATFASTKKRIAQQIQSYREQIERARARRDKAAVAKAESKIRSLEKTARNLKEPKEARVEKSQAVDFEQVQLATADEAGLIRLAYLRTLSRTPSDEELANARNYLSSAGHKAEGLRDLLWALVNTKEFVVNH